MSLWVRSTAAAVILATASTSASAQEGSGSEVPAIYGEVRAETFSTEFPYESRFVEVLGSRMHFVDEGEGDVFLFLHGNPTSSYLWRNILPYVRPHGRVIAVDNVGFGQSDKPDISYTLQDHIAHTDAFIAALGLSDIILVVHDWGSGLGLSYAARNPENVKGVVMMESIIPPAFPAENAPPEGTLFDRFRTEGIGQELIMQDNIFIDDLLGEGTVTRQMPAEAMEAYRAPFPTPESRYPIYVWPNELPMGGEPARNVKVVESYAHWLRTSQTPKLLQYARPGGIISPENAEYAADNFPNLELQFIGYGRHYVQEDNPEAIGRGIAEWHRRNFRQNPEVTRP